MLYVIIIIVSTFLMHIAESKKSKIAILLAILISAVFAGIRSYDTGADIKSYVLYNYNYAKNASLASYIARYGIDSILYSIMVCVSAKLTPNQHWLLFMIQLTINIFFSLSAYKYNKATGLSATMYIYVYYCTFYIYSFNLMRQGMSVSIIAYAMVELLYYKKQMKFLLMLFLAVLVHPTAIVSISILIVYKIMEDNKNLKQKMYVLNFTILLIAVVLVFYFREIIFFLIRNGILSQRYLYSITTKFKEKIDFEKYKILLCLLFMGLTYNIKNFKYKRISLFYLVMLCLSLMGFLIGGVSSYAERIGLYFFVPVECTLIPCFCEIYKIRIGDIKIEKIVFCLLMLFFCIYQFFICNQAAAYPYMIGI